MKERIILSIAMFLLTIDPTFIPHRFGILDFGFKVFCQYSGNKSPQHHHGDLRAALLEVAAEMITDQGMESVALRALSERIGISRTAPYRYFADKSTLPAAVAGDGFKGYIRGYKRGIDETKRQQHNLY